MLTVSWSQQDSLPPRMGGECQHRAPSSAVCWTAASHWRGRRDSRTDSANSGMRSTPQGTLQERTETVWAGNHAWVPLGAARSAGRVSSYAPHSREPPTHLPCWGRAADAPRPPASTTGLSLGTADLGRPACFRRCQTPSVSLPMTKEKI